MTNILINNIYYNLYISNPNYAEVANNFYEPPISGAIVIPSSVTYNSVTYTVKRTNNAAFNYTAITSIIIPNSVTYIGEYTFRGCRQLTSVNLNDCPITTINDSTFQECELLTAITIPSSVTSIGPTAFNFCNTFTTFTIPSSVTSIGTAALAKCSKLTTITIPSSVTSIGSVAFGENPKLFNVIVENQNGITTVSADSFTNVRLESVSSSIRFYNTANFEALLPTWKTISTYYDNVYYSSTQPTLPTLSDFSIPRKNIVDSPFTITPPDSNSDGTFTYASSNTSIATISGNYITIVGAGSSTITATQDASGNYLSGSIQTTFIVNFQITDSANLSAFLNSTSHTYGYVVNDITVDYNLIASGYKVLTGVNSVKISRVG